MIEPDVDQDAGIAAKRRDEASTQCDDDRMRIGVHVDRAMQAEQGEPAPEIPEQSGAKRVELFEGTRGQLRLFRNRWMSFSCSVSRTSSASASA